MRDSSIKKVTEMLKRKCAGDADGSFRCSNREGAMLAGVDHCTFARAVKKMRDDGLLTFKRVSYYEAEYRFKQNRGVGQNEVKYVVSPNTRHNV